MKKLARLGCVALLLTVVPSCKNLPMMGEAQAQASLIPLTIKTSTAVRKFRVEVARTEDEQARGLMFRQSLAEDGGMIFPMSPPRFASFWNASISLKRLSEASGGSPEADSPGAPRLNTSRPSTCPA